MEFKLMAYEDRILTPWEIQALHRRLLKAKESGEEPAPEDIAERDRLMSSPFALFDRPWAPDDY
jgi:hypothetical protein